MTDPGTPEAAAQVRVTERASPRRAEPRLLVTNDDGIDSPGLHRLVAELSSAFELVVAAPDRDMSGSGTGIGRFDPAGGVDLNRVELDGVEAYTVAGPPGLAIMAAALGGFGPTPDLVVSGINAGLNTGHSVIHSGTVGAVLAARSLTGSGLAVSLASSDPWHWATAAVLARLMVEWMLKRTGMSSVINLNAPGLPLSEVRGLRWADLDRFGYFQVATADPAGRKLQFEVTGADAGIDPGSDTALCREGFATLTPLSTVEPEPFPSDSLPHLPVL